MQVEYHKLRPHQLVRRRTECPVAYLPLGILEWHGLHNPLGLDGEKANAVMCYLAERQGGLVMPPLFWGDHRAAICELVFDPAVCEFLPPGSPDHTQGIAEEMRLPKKGLQDAADRSERNGGWRLFTELITHMFFQIESLGFELIVPYAGHGPQKGPLEDAVEAYRHQGGSTEVFVLYNQVDPNWEDHAVLHNQVEPMKEDHAAHFETQSEHETTAKNMLRSWSTNPYIVVRS